MGGWQIKLEAETKRFSQNVSDIVAISPKLVNDVLKDCARSFLESAAKATPESKLKDRKKIQVDERTWKIPFKRIGSRGYMKSKYSGRGSPYFHDENEADIYRKITFRGIYSFGWRGNLFALGISPKIKNSNLMRLLGDVTRTIIKKANIAGQGGEITMSNRVKNIEKGTYAQYTMKEGLFQANKRLSGQLASMKSKLERAWK